MSERRRTDPLPLGGDEPYSKGLMARAFMRVGVSAVRAHEIARRVMASRGRVLAIRKDDIPPGAALAAILRYPV